MEPYEKRKPYSSISSRLKTRRGLILGYALGERLIDIHLNARWKQNGVTVAGGNGKGAGINQLSMPSGLYVDDEQTIYVADRENHRIVEWKSGATSGRVVAGGNGMGSNANQLYQPFDVIVDKESDSLIICDQGNKRVVRWPRRNGISGETIISNIFCRGLTMHDDGSLYVIDNENSEVRRYRRGESQGTVVAGGHGSGHDPNQLFGPQYIVVDKDHAVYVSEHGQSRVTKWVEGVEGRIIVAGGNGKGPQLMRMVYNEGILVDQLGTVYVADLGNGRIMRWTKGATEGSIVVGGNGNGQASNQLNMPYDKNLKKNYTTMATNDGEQETVQQLIEKLLDEEEKTQQVIKQLDDEIKNIKRESEEIQLIEETKHRDEIEKMKHEAQDMQQIEQAIHQYENKKINRETETLERELAIHKHINERLDHQLEIIKRTNELKRQIEEAKRQQIHEACQRKPRKLEIESDSSSTQKRLKVFTFHNDCYYIDIHDDLQSFDMEVILKDNNYFNDNILNYIEHYSNQFSSYPKLNEEEIQKGFDQLIVNLFNTLNNSTSLKYLNTSFSYYLKDKFNPHCTFIHKNININID
ncbi:unnamed protein product, partial [Rotaria sp. Silwood2]